MANLASEHPNEKSYIRLLAKNGKEYFITPWEVYGPAGLTKLRLKWCVSMGYLESLKDPHYELILCINEEIEKRKLGTILEVVYPPPDPEWI